jgi:glycosyltransferase involved in cell wall biosynthesis
MNYYRAIDKSLIQFDFVVQGNKVGIHEEEVEKLGGKVFRVTPMNVNLFKYYMDMYKLVKNRKYDAIHIHHNFANIHALIPAFFAKIPIRISHSHSCYEEKSMLRKIIKKIIRYVINRISTHQLACSVDAGKWLYGKEFLGNGTSFVLKNGIDINKYLFNSQTRDRIRTQLGIKDKFVIGHVGTLNRVKNQIFLIKVFKELISIKPNSHLLLVGTGEDEKKLKEYVEKIGLSNNVSFLGAREDVYDLMQAMDVFVFPSLYEGLGMVLIEAQASGLKCVASNNIPIESNITNSIDLLDLNEPIKKWVEIILEYSNGYVRKDFKDLVTKKGYNINESAIMLSQIYTNGIK